MAFIANAYRRGAIYWWRRQIALAPGERPTVAFGLRTSNPAQARARANALTVASEDFRAQAIRMSAYILTSEIREDIFKKALKRQLDKMIAD